MKKPDKPWRSNAAARFSKSYLTGYEQKLPLDKAEHKEHYKWTKGA